MKSSKYCHENSLLEATAPHFTIRLYHDFLI